MNPMAAAANRPAVFCFVALALAFLLPSIAAAQRQESDRPKPLDPVQAEREARELVATLLTQKPAVDSTNTGRLKIRNGEGRIVEYVVRITVTVSASNVVTIYETLRSANDPGGVRLTVTRPDGGPSRYTLEDPSAGSGARELRGEDLQLPFAGSDFWIGDLGLEFLSWPRHRLLRKEIRQSLSCDVLESVNPQPGKKGYARIVAWVDRDSRGIVHADAYNEAGQVIKRFDPSEIKKVQGEYQVEEMEMINRQTHSRTWLKFDLGK